MPEVGPGPYYDSSSSSSSSGSSSPCSSAPTTSSTVASSSSSQAHSATSTQVASTSTQAATTSSLAPTTSSLAPTTSSLAPTTSSQATTSPVQASTTSAPARTPSPAQPQAPVIARPRGLRQELQEEAQALFRAWFPRTYARIYANPGQHQALMVAYYGGDGGQELVVPTDSNWFIRFVLAPLQRLWRWTELGPYLSQYTDLITLIVRFSITPAVIYLNHQFWPLSNIEDRQEFFLIGCSICAATILMNWTLLVPQNRRYYMYPDVAVDVIYTLGMAIYLYFYLTPRGGVRVVYRRFARRLLSYCGVDCDLI